MNRLSILIIASILCLPLGAQDRGPLHRAEEIRAQMDWLHQVDSALLADLPVSMLENGWKTGGNPVQTDGKVTFGRENGLIPGKTGPVCGVCRNKGSGCFSLKERNRKRNLYNAMIWNP